MSFSGYLGMRVNGRSQRAALSRLSPLLMAFPAHRPPSLASPAPGAPWSGRGAQVRWHGGGSTVDDDEIKKFGAIGKGWARPRSHVAFLPRALLSLGSSPFSGTVANSMIVMMIVMMIMTTTMVLCIAQTHICMQKLTTAVRHCSQQHGLLQSCQRRVITTTSGCGRGMTRSLTGDIPS